MSRAEISAYAKVQLARHPKRPYTVDLINSLFSEFVELAGDRRYADDAAIVAGFAKFEGASVAVIGHQKGRDTHERKYRNFGMPKPEGYRKAMRIMKLAEKFNRPVITFIDTPGAYPGIDAEERGQAEAIANNLLQMAVLKAPIVTIVLGEGGSGGALGIGVCDKLIMLENSVYSVISPEGCAAILWKNNSYAETASEHLKLTASDLQRLNIADVIVEEFGEGAHSEWQHTAIVLSKVLKQALAELGQTPASSMTRNRYTKLRALGIWESSL